MGSITEFNVFLLMILAILILCLIYGGNLFMNLMIDCIY